ncbi:hypothetical protein BN871_EY_00170 [Paenibacillus sp. P22]|nr:hypothetical protein BN871_EY_00170 [Paenibacillus sp. P22]
MLPVSIQPGLTELTRMASPPSDNAKACVSDRIPPLEAAYASEEGSDMNARVEAILTMEPPRPSSFIRRAAARLQRKVPRRLLFSTSSHSSTFSSQMDLKALMPALLIRMSTLPYLSLMPANKAAMSSGLPRSAVHAEQLPPLARIRDAVSSAPARFRSTSTASAPSAAYPSATARPIPEPAPVTTTVFPLNLTLHPPLSAFLPAYHTLPWGAAVKPAKKPDPASARSGPLRAWRLPRSACRRAVRHMAFLVPVLVRGSGKIVLGFLAPLRVSFLLVLERMLFVARHGSCLLSRLDLHPLRWQAARQRHGLQTAGLAGGQPGSEACLECPCRTEVMTASALLFPFWRQTR